jgi:pyruvate dehydrogenase complex dehydrogenase (E1) component
MPRRLASLGTDGFGRSEGRAALRDFFEVDSRFITLATLHDIRRLPETDVVSGRSSLSTFVTLSSAKYTTKCERSILR